MAPAYRERSTPGTPTFRAGSCSGKRRSPSHNKRSPIIEIYVATIIVLTDSFLVARDRTALIDEPLPGLEVLLRVHRLHERLFANESAFFAAWDLSVHQYNVLRIVYVGDEGGVAVGDVGARLISRASDVTRLVDRLVKRGLLERSRDERDRRVVRVALTDEGRDLVEALHPALLLHMRSILEHMSKRDLADLRRLLDRALQPRGKEP